MPQLNSFIPASDTAYQSSLKFLYSFFCATPVRATRRTTIRQLIERLGILPSIEHSNIAQITGTNGKGTCASQLEANLLACGKSTVVLRSPHLYSFRERISINGKTISRHFFSKVIHDLAGELLSARAAGISPTPVEIAFLMVLRIYRDLGHHAFLIIEVGCGGLTDYTNVFASKVVGITRIGQDHNDLFGSQREIAREKIGLVLPGNTCFSVRQNTIVEEEFGVAASNHGLVIQWVENEPAEVCSPRTRAVQDIASVARKIAAELLPNDLVRDGILASHPWRFEKRQIKGCEFYLDGAHNCDAVSQLLCELQLVKQSGWTGIFGIQARKERSGIISLIEQSGLFKRLILVQARRGKFVAPELLAKDFHTTTLCVNSMCDAIRIGIDKSDGFVAVFGSFSFAYDFEIALHQLQLGEYAVPQEQIDPIQPWMNRV